jgi:hypothetical protein
MEEIKKPCNMCGEYIEILARQFKHTNKYDALNNALVEFQRLHIESKCIDNLTCMPICRAKQKLNSRYE